MNQLNTTLNRLALLLPLLAVGCGTAENSLWGSVEAEFPLGFDYLSIAREKATLQIEYVDIVGGSVATPCRLLVDTSSPSFLADARLGTDSFDNGQVRIERNAIDRKDFPSFANGYVQFDQYEWAEGGAVSGSFTVLFLDGQTLYGNFAGPVHEAQPRF